jgi:hypothetical protein
VTRKGEKALEGRLDRALALSARARQVLSVALFLTTVGFALAQVSSFNEASLANPAAKAWLAAFAALALRSAALLGFWVLRSWIPEVMAQQAWRHHHRARAAAARESNARQLLPS